MAKNVCAKSNVRVEAQVLIRSAAEPIPVGDKAKAAINRAAHRLSFSFCRARSIWYKTARRINAEEMDALRAEANKQADQYERVAQAMRNTDEDFYSADIAALVESAKRLRGMGGAGTE